MIEVKSVTKKYGALCAVEDITFSVKKGEVLGFLGPNGAGKTTTMKIITGYMVPTSGVVKIDGEDILDKPLKTKKKIGYLPEIPPLYTDMYVEAYLCYVAGLKNCLKEDIPKQIDSVMEKVGIKSVRKRLIQNLSKGFKQRVGLAQSLIGNPEILILDEPTVGLDPNQILEVRDLISELKKNHTIILSTHILSEVQASCDRIIIIKEGKLVAKESLESLREKQYQTSRRIVLRVKKVTESLLRELNNLKGIENLSRSSDDQALSLSIQPGSDSDLNEQIAKKAISQKAGLVELNESFNLEDIFLHFTSEQKK